MEKKKNIDMVLSTQAENNDVQVIEEFQSTSNRGEVEACDSPTTSANAKKQNTSANVRTNEESEEVNDEAGTANNATSLDCPICLQACIYPARLPCGHIFCFLCIKGVAYKNQRCAMCRGEIPPEFLDRPQLINRMDESSLSKCTEDGYQWFYEGRNGWWQYDTRTSQDIEDAFKNEEKSCTILVAGYVYIVDLETMVQQRQNEPQRCRRVKRDLATVTKKGIAGLRLGGAAVTSDAETAGNIVSSQHDSTYRSQENENIVDARQSRNFESTNATDEGVDLASAVMPLGNLYEHSNRLEQESEENFFPNTVRNNSYESEHRSDDEFQETLTNLQQLTLRASDVLSSNQNESSEDRENRYRNSR